MTPLDYAALLRERRPDVAVLGDFLLDGWWTGSIDRIAREAPAPVVDLQEHRYAPGGAANAAMNAAALGARVQAVGAIGADDAGVRLRTMLRDAGIDVRRLRLVDGMRTTTKVRVAAAGQVMVRLDEVDHEELPAEAARQLARDAVESVATADAQLICDYGSAALGSALIDAVAHGRRPPVRIVDAHDPRRWAPTRPDVVTPNAAETEAILGIPLGSGSERARRVTRRASQLLSATGAAAAVVTLDRSGTLLLPAGGRPHRTYAHPLPEKQASGAGDVFSAALAVARGAGVPLEAATDLAQQAADVAVRKPGTCVCTLDELTDWLGRPAESALGVEELADRLDAHRRAGHRIVFTNGCFDVLHRGHTTYLRQAKRLGDVLVVAVNSDDSVQRLKGPDRPVNRDRDRADVLAELSCVDYVTVFAEDTPRALIRRLRPDVYAKGGDYSPEMLPETPDVRAVGGEVVILDYVADHSTTQIIGRIRSTAEGSDGAGGGSAQDPAAREGSARDDGARDDAGRDEPERAGAVHGQSPRGVAAG
ncbi:D-beta-D-heptose 7-phosphate kinase / D-beta-D-heptose 1-phosphate adenylyltransferase [Microbacterium sp. 8M]|uniref:D-glycero-beta-D-manno-heptose 1-phosphate adenylyltransferase n=1 Tax=Microbacterium sp. 8M TaxID=2653153 RepID=UPI0012EFDAD2|nr:D-glycero-beta-D-manno-heptose 1-phosphate adenylyltransferase [Microbacterium sp. 8M]VXB81936.1 D-beta-D-heptose 7-phosphate kinase / D-beta-D-heptose 1-phosphate adenylyltransferase [Microbacterium sp. 8M]